jgi:hypothetical protein
MPLKRAALSFQAEIIYLNRSFYYFCINPDCIRLKARATITSSKIQLVIPANTIMPTHGSKTGAHGSEARVSRLDNRRVILKVNTIPAFRS